MKFKHQGIKWTAIAALACTLAWQSGRANLDNLPDLGDESASVISPYQERKIGESFMRYARHSLQFIDDPELNEYIQGLGSRLVAHSDAPSQDFLFFLVDDRRINAFAVPGGFIGVNTGLLLSAQSESELAAVLAHETAHITQRHMPRTLARQKRTAGQTMAAVIAAILLVGSGSDSGGAALAVTTATMAQSQLNYSRAFEEEADRIGIRILADADFDPKAMPGFFERLQSANRLNDSNLPEFLSTHPITSRRIAESRNRAEQIAYTGKPSMAAFYHARAKIRAVYADDTPRNTVKTFEHNLGRGKYQSLDAERYGYVYALSYNRQYDRARAEIDKLLRRKPHESRYRIAQAENELAAGRPATALKLYKMARQRSPDYLPLTRYYASALLKTGNADAARKIIKGILRKETSDPTLYKMLATAAGETGNRLEAHQSLAEYYYLNGQAKAAIEQLQIASRFARDNFYAQSSLEARMKEIKEEIALSRKH